MAASLTLPVLTFSLIRMPLLVCSFRVGWLHFGLARFTHFRNLIFAVLPEVVLQFIFSCHVFAGVATACDFGVCVDYAHVRGIDLFLCCHSLRALEHQHLIFVVHEYFRLRLRSHRAISHKGV